LIGARLTVDGSARPPIVFRGTFDPTERFVLELEKPSTGDLVVQLAARDANGCLVGSAAAGLRLGDASVTVPLGVPDEPICDCDQDHDGFTDDDCPAVPVPIAPRDGLRTGADHAPVFRWLGAGPSYDVQLVGQTTTVATTTATTWTPTAPLLSSGGAPVGTRYTWRVRACDATAGCSAWSRRRYLDVGRFLGDLDGDGHEDLIVGAPGAGVNFSGAIWIGYGSPSGFQPSAFQRIDNPTPADDSGFGDAIAVGDVDADGFADVVVGAGKDAVSGTVFVYRGSESGLTLAQTLVPPVDVQAYGQYLAVADFDGDGYDDAAVGAKGALYVLPGGPGGLGDPVPVPMPDELAGLTDTAATGGDVNGDGYPDLALAAPYAGTGGAVALLFGGPAGLAPGWTETFPTASGMLGDSIGLGDLDGDGYADLAAGATGASTIVSWLGGPGAPRRGLTYQLAGIGGTLKIAALGGAHDDLLAGAPAYSIGLDHQGAVWDFRSDTDYSVITDAQAVSYEGFGIAVSVVDPVGDGGSTLVAGGSGQSRTVIDPGGANLVFTDVTSPFGIGTEIGYALAP
jgi:hypothetical protein